METECIQESVSLSDFVQWLRGQVSGDNPLQKYDRNTFSCYLDYKYMQEIFTTKPELLKAVCWESVGLEGRDGTASTLWMGSEGAYTNCHYDAYGYNLVAQIFGRKRWVLFPPSDTQHLYPTRIPFEESSIFSQVDVKHPDLKLHPKVKLTSVHEVILEPGQILYVPRHWWHYVECLEPAISVNTWVELAADTESRFEEAITRNLFSSLWCSHIDMKKQGMNDCHQLGAVGAQQEGANTQEWINPKEEIWDNRRNMFVLSEAYKAIEGDKSGGDGCTTTDCGLVTSDTPDCTTDDRERNLKIFARHFRGKTVIFLPKGRVQGSVIQNKDKNSKPIQGEYFNISSEISSKTVKKPHLHLREKEHGIFYCDDENYKMSTAQNWNREDKLSEKTYHQPTQKIPVKSTNLFLKRNQSGEVYSDQSCAAKVSKLTSQSSEELLTDRVMMKTISRPDTKFNSRNVTSNRPCNTLIKTCLRCNNQDCDGQVCRSRTVAPSPSEISLTAVTPQPFMTWHSVCKCGDKNSDKDENQRGSRILNATLDNSSLDNKLDTDKEVSYYQRETCRYCVGDSHTSELTNQSNTGEQVNPIKTLTFEEFVMCATHPDVIHTIAKVIRNNMTGD
ncbi:uncharacterized protein LOC110451459 isoform X2 [Mizuhopecten yessoensis]|nr:uncharacterized protein LOC110451459 isoform X2 [Mizuhopecten yessoensis]XP_021355184.1 uncharacterized protein LOC110451459 isoform X2 [Mizuhopecten yessoensis]